jgi:hypothetical protein
MKTVAPDLLHNMSAPAKTTISWNAPRGRAFGFGIVFALTDLCNAAHATGLLRLLGDGKRRTVKVAEDELRRRIQARALELPLPPVAAATVQARDGDLECTDPLTIMTVLAKSSSHVYLRDKEPILASIVAGRRIVLIVPEEVTL